MDKMGERILMVKGFVLGGWGGGVICAKRQDLRGDDLSWEMKRGVDLCHR